jgi:hypothetical protein
MEYLCSLTLIISDMEEQILKIIIKGSDHKFPLVDTAREITEHMTKFIEWLMNDCEFWYEMNKHYWEDAESSKKYTLNEVYDYWFTHLNKSNH